MPSRSNPFEEIERLFDRLNRQFEDASRAWESEGRFGRWSSEFDSMAVDLVEHDDEFVVTVDLPGFERDEITVEVTDHTLRVAADHEETIDEGDDDRYVRHERSHRAMRRSVRLPGEVDKEDVSARMKNGVLTVTLPRLEPEEPRRIQIEGE